LIHFYKRKKHGIVEEEKVNLTTMASHMFILCLALLAWPSVDCVELTFELPDNAKECFHEIIEEGTESTLEFQVVTGGHYDVDVILTDPTRNVLYKQIKKQYDSHTWTAAKTGEYIACFSNEFSTFSHKLVYIDFQVGDEDPLPGMEGAVEPLTQMETSAREVHENMNAVIDYQTHHRLRETQSRHRAEDLNERTMIWSVFVTFAIMCVGFGQVFVLKSFFAEKRPSQMYGAH
jgi:protein ERP2